MLLSLMLLSRAQAAAPDAAAPPTLRLGAHRFVFGAGKEALPKGFSLAAGGSGPEQEACGTGAEDGLCALFREGALVAVRQSYSGTDGSYGCDATPGFQDRAISLLTAAGVPNPTSVFGETGLVGGSFYEAQSTNRRGLAGTSWNAVIDVWLDHDSIPMACSAEVRLPHSPEAVCTHLHALGKQAALQRAETLTGAAKENVLKRIEESAGLAESIALCARQLQKEPPEQIIATGTCLMRAADFEAAVACDPKP